MALERALVLLVGGVLWFLAAGCTRSASKPLGGLVTGAGALAGPEEALRGRVERDAFRTQATTGEIGNGAAVLLIDPGSGQILGSTVTTTSGTFVLQFDSTTPFTVATGYPYYLDEIKGLMAGGTPDRPGTAAARLRTLVVWNAGWSSLTGTSIVIDRSTTALSVASNLRGWTSQASDSALIGSLAAGAGPDAVTASFPAVLSADYTSTFNLVTGALALDEDPVGSIYLDPSTDQIVATGKPLSVDVATPSVLAWTMPFQIYGSGFGGMTGTNAAVTINGTPVSTWSVVTSDSLSATVGYGTPPAYPATVSVQLGGVTASATASLAGDGRPVVDPAGNFFFLDSTNKIVYEIASASVVPGAPGTDNVTPTVFYNGGALANPNALALDAKGNVYVSDAGNNDVAEIPNINGVAGTLATVASGLSAPEGLAFDQRGYLYIAESGNNSIVRVYPGVTPAANPQTFVTGTAVLATPWGLCFDGHGNLYVANQNGGTAGTGYVSKVNPYGVVTTYYSGLTGPTGMAADGFQWLYVGLQNTGTTTPGTSTVFRMPLNTAPAPSNSSNLIVNLTNPRGLGLDPWGALMVADFGTTGGTGTGILRFDYPTTLTTYVLPGTLTPTPGGLGL